MIETVLMTNKEVIKYRTEPKILRDYIGYEKLQLEIDSEGMLRTKLYDKRDNFNFLIVNFPFICSNIPAAHAHGIYISQLIRYSRACGSYQDFLDSGLLLTRKLPRIPFGKVEVITSKVLWPPP